MSKEEFKDSCDTCLRSGGQTFARIFFKKIKGEWKHLCNDCWTIKTTD